MQWFETSVFPACEETRGELVDGFRAVEATYNVNAVICSSRLAQRCSSSLSRVFVTDSLSEAVTKCPDWLTELIELAIDSDNDGCVDACCEPTAATEDDVDGDDADDEVDGVFDSALLSTRVDVDMCESFNSFVSIYDEYVGVDNTGVKIRIFVGDSGSINSTYSDSIVASISLSMQCAVRIRSYDESLQIAWILSMRCFSFSPYFRQASDNETIGDLIELLLWLDVDSISSSSNDMIGFRLLAVDFGDNFASLHWPTTGTAMIISFCFCNCFISTGATTFNSELSTVTANRIDPKPENICWNKSTTMR